jgi:hypothetical protein
VVDLTSKEILVPQLQESSIRKAKHVLPPAVLTVNYGSSNMVPELNTSFWILQSGKVGSLVLEQL